VDYSQSKLIQKSKYEFYLHHFSGVELKFTEPLDASIPDEDWRLYTFKDNQNEGKNPLPLLKTFFILIVNLFT
jgi:hypothetical protein